MKCKIYYTNWNGKEPDSHELLIRALISYLYENGEDALEDVMGMIHTFSQDITGVESLGLTREDEYSKPYFSKLPKIHFSISHSGDYWMCAFADAEVGLDLQEVGDRKMDRIAKRFFHSEEVDWLQKNDNLEFYRVWAAKESYLKYTGQGLRLGMDHFSVIDPDKDTYLSEVMGIPQFHLHFDEKYPAVLTGKISDFELKKL